MRWDAYKSSQGQHTHAHTHYKTHMIRNHQSVWGGRGGGGGCVKPAHMEAPQQQYASEKAASA